jgi:hypothetical protein
MVLSYEQVQAEIDASKAALKAHEDGIEVHKIVIKAFEEALAKLPKPKKKERTKSIG